MDESNNLSFSSASPIEPWAPISWGELIDKITILEIKLERLTTQEARQNVHHELRLLGNVASQFVPPPRLFELKANLRAVNQRLWEIENAIRGKEAQKLFDEEFIELARSVYIMNDERGRIKRNINLLLNSRIIEEKQYLHYESEQPFNV
jgi:hypothetical protein